MGRTSLLLVMAFNVTFMMMGYRMSSASSKAYDKYCGYADVEQAGLAMESCANIAISYALLDTPRVNTFSRCSNTTLFGKSGAAFTVTQYPTFDKVGVQVGESLMVTSSYSLPSAILPTDLNPKMYDTTYITVTGNSFSTYVFYSQIDGTIYWTTGDTCRGKLHTQDNLRVNGDADFKGKVTTKGSVTISSGAHPNFEQSYSKADISLPQDLTELNKLGLVANGGRLIKNLDTYVQFNSNGSVTVKTEPRGTATSTSTCWNQTSTAMNASPNGTIPKCTTYASISALTTDGVLLVQNAELHVKGVLDGKITLGCVDTVNGSGVKTGLSSVWIDESVTYKEPPPCTRAPSNTSNDMLGIVTTNNINVSEHIDNDPGKATLKNVTINASMFSQTGSFTAENYGSRGDCGKLSIVGGIQQKTRGAVGTGNPITDGFHKDYDWDNNLLKGAPAGYPITKFAINNWVDIVTIPKGFWE
jgi:hypothetical protein